MKELEEAGFDEDGDEDEGCDAKFGTDVVPDDVLMEPGLVGYEG